MTGQVLRKPLITHLLPVAHPILKPLLQIGLGVIFIALLAQVSLELGPVPITGSNPRCATYRRGPTVSVWARLHSLATLLSGVWVWAFLQVAQQVGRCLSGTTAGYLVWLCACGSRRRLFGAARLG